MDSKDDHTTNPFAAPSATQNPWRFDRSGVWQRVQEICGVSLIGGLAGSLIGHWLFPNLRLANGGNFLVMIGAIAGLVIWSVLKMRTMWKPADAVSNPEKSDGRIPQSVSSSNRGDD